MSSLNDLKKQIVSCTLCQERRLIPEANPILQISTTAKVAVFGQAPGNLAHQSGRPFFDPSGVRLREWMGVTEEQFYDASKVAIVPMAFCFPGYDGKGATGKAGDLPPPALCAETWRQKVMDQITPQLELVLLVGNYAQRWHLGDKMQRTLTDTVRMWRSFVTEAADEAGPVYVPLPHPSWRNIGWFKKNPWFGAEVLPFIQSQIRRQLDMHF